MRTRIQHRLNQANRAGGSGTAGAACILTLKCVQEAWAGTVPILLSQYVTWELVGRVGRGDVGTWA